MLELNVTEKEVYDSGINKFISTPECKLTLEHSLISLAKWESKWLVPFFGPQTKTQQQEIDYIRCMVIGPIKDDRVFDLFSPDEIHQVREYIQSPMTATTFSESKTTGNAKQKKEIITAEVLYARMCIHSIPFDCQKWHLNRLLTLIKVCDLQNAPKEKMSKKQSAQWAAEQNAARRAKYNTRG